MNDYDYVTNAARYRYEKYLREADHERLVRLVLKNQPSSETVRARFLLWLGQRLTSWGTRLLERYRTDQVNSGRMLGDSIQSSNGC